MTAAQIQTCLDDLYNNAVAAAAAGGDLNSGSNSVEMTERWTVHSVQLDNVGVQATTVLYAADHPPHDSSSSSSSSSNSCANNEYDQLLYSLLTSDS